MKEKVYINMDDKEATAMLALGYTMVGAGLGVTEMVCSYEQAELVKQLIKGMLDESET